MKYIINKNIENEFIINKSRFIVCLFNISCKEEIDKNMNYIKNKYKDATHYCYAYIFNSYEKCSDDKEPSGTAGLPILNVLKKNNLNKILCVVVRYFGGIKLGAGGLLRAYSSTVSNTIKNISPIEDIEYENISIEFSYDKIKKVEHILRDCEIIDKSFNDLISFVFKIDTNKKEIILEELESFNVKVK